MSCWGVPDEDCFVQLQDAHAAEVKKISQELEEVRAHMKKTQLRADEVQGTFESHNGDYLRMKVLANLLTNAYWL